MSENVDFRLNKLTSDLSAQFAQKGHSSINVEREAKKILMNYAEELTAAILDNAAVLAQNRQSNEISEADLSLLLGIIYLSFVYVH